MRRMPALNQTAFSFLDLVPVREGGTVAQAIAQSVRTAQHVEQLGFTRYWLAEHHNMTGIACSATAVLVGHIAGATSRIRVGSGGVMLPNHAPLVVAEAFGTLAEMYPGRIDLGLGRAPGTDPHTMRALRRNVGTESAEDFPRDVAELEHLLGEPEDNQRLVATPGAGTNVPIWLLGSSLFSAQLAAYMGRPYAFASHFAPRMLMQALEIYRANYRPSTRWPKPHAMVGVPVIAAPTDDEAQLLASSSQQRVLSILTGQRGKLKPPVEGFMASLDERAKAGIEDFQAMAVIGSPATVKQGLAAICEATQADELMFVCDIYEPELRLRSLDIVAGCK